MRIAAGDAADERSEREEERLDLSAGGSGTTSHETCRLASASPLATRLPAGVSSCAQRSNRSLSTSGTFGARVGRRAGRWAAWTA